MRANRSRKHRVEVAMNDQEYEEFMKHPIVLDGRNCYQLSDFEGTKITYDSIGRRTVNPDLYMEK